MTDQEKKEEEKQQEIREIVIARLEVLPPDTNISIGSEGSFNKNQLIEHIKKNDSIGKKIVEVELEYLKLLKEGKIYEQNFLNNTSFL